MLRVKRRYLLSDRVAHGIRAEEFVSYLVNMRKVRLAELREAVILEVVERQLRVFVQLLVERLVLGGNREVVAPI